MDAGERVNERYQGYAAEVGHIRRTVVPTHCPARRRHKEIAEICRGKVSAIFALDVFPEANDRQNCMDRLVVEHHANEDCTLVRQAPPCVVVA